MSRDYDFERNLNKRTLVPAGASITGTHGKGIGFYCDACDMTFKDSIHYLDHCASQSHLSATGESAKVQSVGLAQVRQKLEELPKADYDLDKARAAAVKQWRKQSG